LIDPKTAYSDLVGKGQPDVINWNTGAIVGEFLRHKAGFTGLDFVNRYLDLQIKRFTPEGLYRDPGQPLAYDAAARFNFLVLLDDGYDGLHRAALDRLLERGAWASLLMQAPAGDAPTGGRSAEHLWIDALQCASFELWARRMRVSGDEAGARAFKRGAHLSARLIYHWVRPSGDLWIVKNRFDPALRRGFESYSYHSQYNLLAAAYLALAWSSADERISEGPSPADTGGFVLDLPAFHKVFANSGGNFIEIELAADPHYNSEGLLRAQTRGSDGALTLRDNAPASEFPLALGVGWRTAGQEHSLAEYASDKAHAALADVVVTSDAVRFAVAYRLDTGPFKQVTERYTLTPDALEVTVTLDGPVEAWRILFPAFLSDGIDIGRTTAREAGLVTRCGPISQRFDIIAPQGIILKKTGRMVTMRTGDYEVFEGAGSGNTVRYRLSSPARDTATADELKWSHDANSIN